MFTLIAVAGLAVLASAAENSLKIGSAIQVSLDIDSPKCPIVVDVTSAQADAECKIQFHAPRCGLNAEVGTCLANPVLAYAFRKDDANFGVGDNVEAVADTDGEVVEVACPNAGTYYLGVEIKSCTECKLGKNGNIEIAATLKKGDKFLVDIENDSRSGRILIKETETVEFHYKVEQKATAHFNIDKCLTCATDNYKYQFGPVGGNLTDISSGSGNLIQIADLAPGSHRLVVGLENGLTSDSSWFLAKFKLNADPGPNDYDAPEAVCAQLDCSKASVQNCDDCASENCNWCVEDNACTQGACSASTVTVITDDDKCSSASTILMSAGALLATMAALV